ncbi:MAG: hypothetical protein R3C44_05540 [Chloroflexota bacterium]
MILGASPRGSLALYRSSQAYAAIHGRDYVVPDDVKHLAPSFWHTDVCFTLKVRYVASPLMTFWRQSCARQNSISESLINVAVSVAPSCY